MAAHDLEMIFQCYPEMVLMSTEPVKWEGFLRISHQSCIDQNTRVKIKLSVPNYPSLQGTKIRFGSKLNLFHNSEFYKKVNNLLERATTVLSLLKQLQILISEFTNFMDKIDTKDVAIEMINELKETFWTYSEVQLSSNSNLDVIKLSLRGISMVLQRTNDIKNPWKVLSSDLPEVSSYGPFEKNLTTIRAVQNKFKLRVDIFEKSWNYLKEIDENCWVIDPCCPKPNHLYRRIYLNPNVSVLITVDPLNPMDLPDINLMGSELEVRKQRDIISERLHDWNPQCGLLENLLTLFNITEFPQKVKEEIINDDVVVTDNECCICFSLTINNVDYPDKICANKKCRKNFHASCLLEWLQTVPGNQVAFGYIYGTCPNCGENISCYIGSS